MDVRPSYLFDPELIEARIAPLPRTAKLIHAKKRTGAPSAAFPKLHKTEREILRILGRARLYGHLDQLLQSLEHCLANGWDAHQLGARDRDEFASLMSDLQVAEHCLLRNFTIESPVGLAIQGAKPDLYVRKDDVAAIIEVFRPRELQAFHNFLTDVSRLLMEADIALDYQADVKLGCVSDFDESGRLASPWHPCDLDEALAPIAEDALQRVAAKVAVLAPAARELIVEEWPERNLRLTVNLSYVRTSVGDEPARSVSYGQSYGGYEPTGMLARMTKPIIDKAKKQQAGERGEQVRVLVCDVSDTIVAPHLQDEHRKKRYVEILIRDLEPQVKENYDVVALCERRGWGKPLYLHFCECTGPEYHRLVGELFGAFQTLTP